MFDLSLHFFKLWFCVFWLLYLPGVLLSYLLAIPKLPDRITNIGLQLGLGMAFWPLLLLWSDLVIRLKVWKPWTAHSGQLAVLFIGLSALAVLGLTWWRVEKRRLFLPSPQRVEFAGFLLLFVVTIVSRWQQIHQLVLPNWVDSIHHTMIAQLLIEHGALPDTYTPFLPEANFVYHWGFHALVAWLAWWMGINGSLQIATLILQLGQIFNVLALLMLYIAGNFAFHSRRAALFSASFGALISWYPAYYTSWGRYPHLVGLLLFPLLMVTIWKLRSRQSRLLCWRLSSMLLLAGIILIHVRITLFVLSLLFVLSVWLLIQRRWRVLIEWVIVGSGAALLTSPWLVRLALQPKLPQLLIASANSTLPQVNSPFPWQLLWVPGIPELTSLATGGVSGWFGWGGVSFTIRILSLLFSVVILALLFVFHLRGDQLIQRFPHKSYIVVVSWCALLYGLLQLHDFGLPQLAFVNQDSLAITFFAPVSLAAGGMTSWIVTSIVPRSYIKGIATLLAILIGVWGASKMQNVVNASTTLVDRNDLAALEWIRTNMPADTKFAVQVRPWIGATYVGTDGGYWIPLLTDRASIMPPAIYTIVLQRNAIQQINSFLQRWSKISEVEDPATYDFLRENGVTAIYIGSRSTSILRQTLLKSPYVDLIYDQNSVRIFALHAAKDKK